MPNERSGSIYQKFEDGSEGGVLAALGRLEEKKAKVVPEREAAGGETELSPMIQPEAEAPINVKVSKQASVDTGRPLHDATREGDKAKVLALLDQGADIDEQRLDGVTPLMLAVQNRRSELAQALVDMAANVNKQDKNGQTALHMAALGGQLDMVQLLVNARAGVNIVSTDGTSPLHLACLRGDDQICRLLIHHDANTAHKTISGNSIMHFAAHDGNRDIAEMLIHKGVSLDEVDIQGRTPLHVAALRSKYDVAELLIEYRADTAKEDKLGQTALTFATNNKHSELIELLVMVGELGRRGSQQFQHEEQLQVVVGRALALKPAVNAWLDKWRAEVSADMPRMPTDIQRLIQDYARPPREYIVNLVNSDGVLFTEEAYRHRLAEPARRRKRMAVCISLALMVLFILLFPLMYFSVHLAAGDYS